MSIDPRVVSVPPQIEVRGGLYSDLVALINNAHRFLHAKTEPLVTTQRTPAGSYQAVLNEIIRSPAGPIEFNDVLLPDSERSGFQPTRHAALIDLLERMELRVWSFSQSDAVYGSAPRVGFDTVTGADWVAGEEVSGKGGVDNTQGVAGGVGGEVGGEVGHDEEIGGVKIADHEIGGELGHGQEMSGERGSDEETSEESGSDEEMSEESRVDEGQVSEEYVAEDEEMSEENGTDDEEMSDEGGTGDEEMSGEHSANSEVGGEVDYKEGMSAEEEWETEQEVGTDASMDDSERGPA